MNTLKLAGLLIVLIVNANLVFGQQWSGSNNTTSTLSRSGDVTVGSSNGLGKLEVMNGSNSQWAFTAMNTAGGGGAGLFKSGWINGTEPVFQVETSISGASMSSPGHLRFTVRADGKVGVGTNNLVGDHLLYVGGKAICEELTVKLEGNWPDFVFADKYELMSLGELESFIQENHHLPNVPSEEEVKEEGIQSGKMDAILLQKIEELTLYVIELEKEINLLKNK
ncbi:hypothetical protein KFE98_16865 [bacterium SCSIO 12741]|nr:hypothetical protein KFE98_16865 [bacterium SCSIO 12741]